MKWVLSALTLLFQHGNAVWALKMLRVPPAGVCSGGSGGRAASLAGPLGLSALWGDIARPMSAGTGTCHPQPFGVTQPVPQLQAPGPVTIVPLHSESRAPLLPLSCPFPE